MRTWVDRARRKIEERVDQAWALSRKRVRGDAAVEPFDGDVRFALLTVNFSTTPLLKLMLLTLSEQTALERVRRIVVVDNDSRDGGVAFLRELALRVPRISLVENRHFLTHARGMRTALRHLDRLDHDEAQRANVLLFVDTDVIFRSPTALEDLARTFDSESVAAAGELRRGLFPYPEAQASFLAVRRDCYARPDVAPWVNHGSPAYWLQRSLWQAGLNVAHFPSNAAGHVLHRGRAGVSAAHTFRPLSSYASAPNREPHYMGVPNGAEIWAAIERRYAPLLDERHVGDLYARLACRLG